MEVGVEPTLNLGAVAAEGILRCGGQSYLSRYSPINQQKKSVLVGRYIPTVEIHIYSSRLEQSHSSILYLTAE